MKAQDPAHQFNSPSFLERLRSREHEAVTALVQAHTHELLNASLGLGFDRSSAAELVQSVWVTFFDVVANFRGESKVRTYLFGILYNKASALKRDHRRHDSADPIEELLENRFDQTGHWIKAPVSPEEFLLGSESLERIRQCMDALPLTQRMAFALKEVQEKDTPEICRTLDVSVSNLGVLLFRARNRLRECIEGKLAGKRAQS